MAVEMSPVLVCDQCGYRWLQALRSKAKGLPYQCANQGCRSIRWNSGKQGQCKHCGQQLSGNQKQYCSRRCKDSRQSRMARQGIWRGEDNRHHELCACIGCLAAIYEAKKMAEKGKKTRTDKGITRGHRRDWGRGDTKIGEVAANGG